MAVDIVTEESGKRIVIENMDLRVVIEPEMGGKIRSFFSKHSGTEYFYQDSRRRFQTKDNFSQHDISGYDECFPTVWACSYPDDVHKGMSLADHGYLWQSPWSAKVNCNRVAMEKDIPELKCRFERVCTLDSTRSLRLDYRITNDGDEKLKYLYSAHPLLSVRNHTELILPQEIRRMFVYVAINAPGLADKTWIEWPPARNSHLWAPFSKAKGSVVKLYSPKLENSKAVIRHDDVGEGLQFDFDTNVLPHLGVLYQQGYDSDKDGHFKSEIFLALEPTTSIGDDLATCKSTGTLREILPGESVDFWIRLSLTDL